MVCPLMSHMTLGRGCPVSLQQKRAQSPSFTEHGSGFSTNWGASGGFSSSAGISGARFHCDSSSWILFTDSIPAGTWESYTIPGLPCGESESGSVKSQSH